jgi:hypothetical protein
MTRWGNEEGPGELPGRVELECILAQADPEKVKALRAESRQRAKELGLMDEELDVLFPSED